MVAPLKIDENLYKYCTPRQRELLEAIELHSSAKAARGGWIADRAAWAITYHKKYGAVGRVMITTEMLDAV